MDQSVIARNIRSLRDSRHWTQEELALAADVDVRTIQRAEAGHHLGVESLKAIAAAFNTTIELLSVSEEQLAAQIEEFRKKYKIIDVDPIKRGVELSRFLTATEAFQFEKSGEFTDDQLDAIAEFESDLRDWMEIGSDLSPITSRGAVAAPFFDPGLKPLLLCSLHATCRSLVVAPRSSAGDPLGGRERRMVFSARGLSRKVARTSFVRDLR